MPQCDLGFSCFVVLSPSISHKWTIYLIMECKNLVGVVNIVETAIDAVLAAIPPVFSMISKFFDLHLVSLTKKLQKVHFWTFFPNLGSQWPKQHSECIKILLFSSKQVQWRDSPFTNLNTMLPFMILPWPRCSHHDVTVYDVRCSRTRCYRPPPKIYLTIFFRRGQITFWNLYNCRVTICNQS